MWYRRNLPHWHPRDTAIFLTWRLHGTLPGLKQSTQSSDSAGKQFVEMDRQLDRARSGPCYLLVPEVAQCVLSAIREAEQDAIDLGAYVIMPNHVHLLFTPKVPISQTTRKIKGASARQANRILGRTGIPFWQDESFDHWVRDPWEFRKIRRYIERNPVTAGLVREPHQWTFSSASRDPGDGL